MLDAETWRTIRNMPMAERIALIMALLDSLDTQSDQDTQSDYHSLIHSWQSPLRGNQISLNDWKAFVLQGTRQIAALSSEPPKRATFGFMKDTGSIHEDIIAPVVPESDWEVFQ